jgi:hypothetical protein
MCVCVCVCVSDLQLGAPRCLQHLHPRTCMLHGCSYLRNQRTSHTSRRENAVQPSNTKKSAKCLDPIRHQPADAILAVWPHTALLAFSTATMTLQLPGRPNRASFPSHQPPLHEPRKNIFWGSEYQPWHTHQDYKHTLFSAVSRR